MSEETIGAKAKCAMCGESITFVGPYWDHDGEIKPRHPATPKPWGTTVVNASNFTGAQREELKEIIRAEIERAFTVRVPPR